jgi:hypothetical protein
MTRSQFDDATIVKTIQAFNTDLDISVAALVKLKEAGVTKPVIQAMLVKAAIENKLPAVEHSNAATTPTSGRSSKLVEEPTT